MKHVAIMHENAMKTCIMEFSLVKMISLPMKYWPYHEIPTNSLLPYEIISYHENSKNYNSINLLSQYLYYYTQASKNHSFPSSHAIVIGGDIDVIGSIISLPVSFCWLGSVYPLNIGFYVKLGEWGRLWLFPENVCDKHILFVQMLECLHYWR